MAVLDREVALVQNPALGAMLLWRFSVHYVNENNTHEAVPLPLLFIVLPICLHQETAKITSSTQASSGLRFFAGKFANSATKKGDLLLAIHDRALRMRPLTLESLRIAMGCKLILLLPEKGLVVPGTTTSPRAGIPASITEMLKVAEKLGKWCAAVSLHEVSALLKVRF